MASFRALHRDHIIRIALGALALSFLIARFNEFIVGSIGDDAVYVAMARSIAEGRGPVINLHPSLENQLPFAFPAGYPLLLSPLAFFYPANLVPFKLFSIFMPLAAVPIYYAMGRSLLKPNQHTIAAIAIFISPWIITYSNRALSEASFIFFSLASLFVYIRWIKQQSVLNSTLILLCILLGLSASIRTVGLALIISVLCHLLLLREFRRLLIAILFWCLAFAPQIWANMLSGGDLISAGYSMQVLAHSTDLGARTLHDK